MATTEQYINAAKIPPSKRTAEQQALVTKGSNIQAVRNEDQKAKDLEKVYG